MVKFDFDFKNSENAAWSMAQAHSNLGDITSCTVGVYKHVHTARRRVDRCNRALFSDAMNFTLFHTRSLQVCVIQRLRVL